MLMLEDEPSFVGECSSNLKAVKILNKRSEDVKCFTCDCKNKSLYRVEHRVNEHIYCSLGIFCKDCMLKTFRLKEKEKEN